jgi:hypothetical protein
LTRCRLRAFTAFAISPVGLECVAPGQQTIRERHKTFLSSTAHRRAGQAVKDFDGNPMLPVIAQFSVARNLRRLQR